MKTLYTPWGETLDRSAPLQEYPRPQLVRDSYLNLNGIWEYKVLHDREVVRCGQIVVPFSPECPLSGCDFQLQPHELLRYERTFTLPDGFQKDRVLLHFGAVDQICTVDVNGYRVGSHKGGYLPFTFDVTAYLCHGENRLRVDVQDATDRGIHAYGKQKYDRGGIWYTAQSGIWQTVWMESVPDNYITRLELTPDFDARRLYWRVHAQEAQGAHVVVRKDGVCIAEDWDYHSDDGSGWSLIPDEDFRPWCPEDPFLYTVEVDIKGGDHVESYFGMRKFSTEVIDGKQVLCLNNEPYFQHGLLDQGYWSDGFYTAPSDEALVYDIEKMKSLGFNMLRKHIKIEPLRWYYHCDRLGMLVWQDAVSGGETFSSLYMQVLPFIGCDLNDAPSRKFGRENEEARAQFERDLHGMIDHLYNSVSLCMWVPFNEGWGQFDAKRISAGVKCHDPGRWVDHASGWHDQGGGDLRSYHIYYRPLRLRHDGKRALALSEFGGYSLPVKGHCTSEKKFGYRAYKDSGAFMDALCGLYEQQLLPLIRRHALSAAVYTQLSDVEDEVNGLLTYDRRVCKVDESRMRALGRQLKY